MRILHLISQKPSFTGSGTFYTALVNESIKHNISPFLCYAVSSKDPNKFYFECDNNTVLIEFENSKVRFAIPGMSDVMPYESSIFSKLSSQQLIQYYSVLKEMIKKSIKKFKPDIIWSHHLWIASSLIKEIDSDIPVIAFCHGSDLLQATKSTIFFEKIKLNLEKIEVIVSTSPSQVNEIKELINARRIVYIGNGIRNDIFYLRKGQYRKELFLKLIYAGKLSKEKGVHCLISAVKLLIQDGVKIKLNLIGGGSKEEIYYLKSLIKGYENEIQFIGMISQWELSNYLNNSDIFVLPSFYEGLGLVALEAISCGCTVIITDLPNLKSIIPEEVLELKVISNVSLPNIHGSLELNELSDFCYELKEKIKIQMTFYQNSIDRLSISKLAKEFTYKKMFENLIGISKELISLSSLI